MSKLHHAIYIAIIVGLLAFFGLSTPRLPDQSAQSSSHHVVVFPFGSADDESEAIAAQLTSALIRSLENVPGIQIASVSDLPESMRNPSDHHLWPKGGPVTLFVEGFVRNSDEGLRVTAQLVNTRSNDHAWSSTYEGGREITSDVVAAVEGQVVLIARSGARE